ncbi:acyl-CoA N-acyltransferase [Cristinia sonorae]|uniref:Acyl-CoA N-acyltransferase n=1 Tax=Cristinia sonorae TaxID=1940300 RepID=A0A8K0UV04_9AGAR|nr:acyl-CoA N-acyltransferase [Cristinia sonorae]
MSQPPTLDANFCFPVKDLESSKVKLTPFNPSRHAETYFAGSSPHPEIYDYLPWGPFPSSSAFVQEVYERLIQPDRGMVLLVVLDKTKTTGDSGEPALAGLIGLLNTSRSQHCTEIGFVITLPPFRRTHVTSHATALLLQWCLNRTSEGGLGMRRVQWQTNELNVASARAAVKMGFRFEGVIRWQRVLAEGKQGPERFGEDGKKEVPGRHTKMFSLCWDDWEEGEKEKINARLERDQIRD